MKSALCAGLIAVCLQAFASEVRLNGRAVDENGAAVSGVLVSVRAAGGAQSAAGQAIADPTGKFSIPLPAPGDYVMSASREGFFRVKNHQVHAADGMNEITLVLNTAREVFEKAEVSYSPPTIDFDRTSSDEQLTGTQLLEVPYPSTNTLRNAMRALPGVTQDSTGGIHLNGGAEEQILYTLDGFQINDPLTGQFDTRLSVEAVKSLEVTSMNPAEFGKGATGTLAIKTSTGDDQFRYSATNFFPGVENRKGLIIGGWTPRFNFSGPVKRGRIWFSDGLDLQYDKKVVEELPAGQDSSTSWRAGNILRNQINLTPSNVVYTSFLANFWIAPKYGLSALDPVETTVDSRTRQWFLSFKDQWYFARGALLELGYALSRTFARDIPQGHGMLFMTQDGRHGYSYWDAARRSGRNQFLGNVFLPSFTRFGAHQFKTGIDLSTVSYRQDETRTGYAYLRADNLPSRTVAFGGSGLLRRTNSEAAAYFEDSWRIRPNILVEAGLRQDWDRLLGDATLSPRLGIAWSPPGMEATKVSGGFGIISEEANLTLFSRPLDQYPLTTHYLTDGTVTGPAASVFIAHGELSAPRYRNWTAAVEHRFIADLYARFQYTRRRTQNGLAYINTLEPGSPAPDMGSSYSVNQFDAIYRLVNSRRDEYDAFEATVRKTFRRQYEWLASYTRSRAFSSEVIQPAQNNPILVTANAGRMPWDTPNRFVSWGYLPTFWNNWAVAYLMEWRDGYPYSIQNDQGVVQGNVNAFRFPMFFELNLHLERRFVFRNNRWAFRFGFNNITNHENPNVVNDDMSSPHFLTYYGGQSRAFNLRLRWLGKL